MRIDLTGSTALVTGSTQGIGYAIADGLLDAGARVIVNGRGEEGTAAARDRLLAAHPGASVEVLAADVATEEGAARAVELFPEVDVLVNNLGIFGSADPLDITDDEWRRYFEVNVLAAVRLTRAYLPGMMARAGAGCSTSRATRPS